LVQTVLEVVADYLIMAHSPLKNFFFVFIDFLVFYWVFLCFCCFFVLLCLFI